MTLSNSGAANAVSITDVNAITFGAMTLGGALTVNAGGLIATNGVANTGVQQYNGATSLSGAYVTNGGNFNVTGATTLAGATTVTVGAGSANFTTVDGAQSLSVNSSGTETFGIVGGTTPLASISTDAPGTVVLNGNVTTTGAQTFNDAMILNAATALNSTGGGAIALGSTVNGGSSLAIGTTGTVTLGGAINLPGQSFIVAGTLPTQPAPQYFPDLINIPTAGPLVINVPISTGVGTGTVILSSTAISGNAPGAITTGDLRLNSTGSVINSQNLLTTTTNLFVSGKNGSWVLGGTPPTGKASTATGADIGLVVGGTTLTVSSFGAQAENAASTAAANAAAVAAQEAKNTFGTDSVAEQIEYGFAGDVGNLPPMDHRLLGVGISVPKCFNESREGEDC